MNSFAIGQHAKNPNHTNSSAGYAFFPGTGPSLRTCGECAFAAKIGSHTHCRKWSDLKRSNKHGPAISQHSDACKYFSQKGA